MLVCTFMGSKCSGKYCSRLARHVTFFITLQTAHKVYLLGPGWKTRRKKKIHKTWIYDVIWGGKEEIK